MELRLDALASEWKSGRHRPAYLFYGETSAVAEALSAARKALGGDEFNTGSFDGSDPQAAVSEALTAPVFTDRRLVVIESPKLSPSARAAFADYLKEPLQSTALVLVSEDSRLDPRDALAQAVSACGGAVCPCGPLRPDEAERALAAQAKRAGKSLDPQAAALLIEEAGTDPRILRQELERAILFAGKEAAVTRDHVAECLGYQKALNPFALTNLIQRRSRAEALSHLRRMWAAGKADEQAFRALAQVSGVVMKQFRAKRMLAAGSPAAEIQRALRLHPYHDRDYLSQIARLPEARLRRDLERCLDAEVSLKSRAWLDPKIEIEHLVAAVCA